MTLIITLVAIGIFLLAVEVLIIPGLGFAGILGLLAIVGAVILAFTQFGHITGLIVLAAVIIITSLSTWLMLRSKTWKKVSLNESINSKVDLHPTEKGLLPGTKGFAISRLAPGGKARFGNIDTEVHSRIGIINNGAAVEIVDINDNKIIVKQID